MTHICHLFDNTTDWEQRVGVSQLVDRAPDQLLQSLFSIDSAAIPALVGLKRRITTIARRGRLALLAAPSIALAVRRHGIDVVHAWGIPAASAAVAAGARPMVLTLFDPAMARAQVGRIRILASSKAFAVSCASETVRRRLVEGGVSPDRCVVIRPGVDFRLINRWQRGSLRKTLGVASGDFLITVPVPVTRNGGQFDVLWAAKLINLLHGGVRMVLPPATGCDAGEQERLKRLDALHSGPEVLVAPPPGTPVEALITVSDALIVTPRGDSATTAIGWAMAAETVVIGTAVHSVAELIASKVNGLLFKAERGKNLAPPIVHRVMDRASHERVKEVARGHAYEVFSVRRYVEQQARLYKNLLSGVKPHEGIVDSAISA